MKSIKITMLVILLVMMLQFVSAAVLEADIIIGREKTAASLKVDEGRASDYSNESGNYRLEIKDAAGAALWARNYDVKFVILTNPPQITDYEIITEKIEYDSKMYEMYFYRDSDVLLHRYLDFCDANGFCDRKENAVSCPADCSVADYDGICIAKDDGICDPDCIADNDCMRLEQKRKKLWVSALIAFAVSVIGGICFVHFEKKKVKTAIGKVLSAWKRFQKQWKGKQ
ncbi:MAG: hypothetical protein KJ955_08055 [Nanoarchaeota archaeon]|nr:hypothetical protein [Nanoarchaeota archaeon]